MSENFSNLKQKAFRLRLLKSALAGASAFLAVFGALVLFASHQILPIGKATLIAVSVTVPIAAGVGTFFLSRISDRTLAKQLDKRHGLEERVQTMLQYQEADGAIYVLQRKDANEALEKVSDKSVALHRLWIYALCLVLSAALFASSFLFAPAEEPPIPEVTVPFAITPLQAAALEELIGYVNNSEMTSPYRENVGTAVSTLLVELQTATTTKERDAALSKAIDEILKQTDASSSALELMNALWLCESESGRLLAKTLNYYDWPAEDAWETFSAQLEEFRLTLLFTTSASEANLLYATVSADITSALAISRIPQEDSLQTVLTALAVAKEERGDGTHVWGLSTLSPMADTLWEANLQIELDNTLAAIGGALFTSLSQHAANTGTGEYAITRICTLFEHPLPTFERPKFRETLTEDTDGDSAEGGASGSVGGGPTFGSDDLVFDPLTNEYVEYGTILQRYAEIYYAWMNGDHTEEEKAAMEKYFDILKGGFKED